MHDSVVDALIAGAMNKNAWPADEKNVSDVVLDVAPLEQLMLTVTPPLAGGSPGVSVMIRLWLS